MLYTERMKYEVRKSDDRADAYVAVAVNDEKGGREEPCAALFWGPEAKQRAEEYAEWQNRQLETTGEQLLRR